MVEGVPGRSLVDAARTLEAELLVLSSRGDGALSWLVGSQYVLRNAPCPILIVPDPGPALAPLRAGRFGGLGWVAAVGNARASARADDTELKGVP